jgi:hypothetical protein
MAIRARAQDRALRRHPGGLGRTSGTGPIRRCAVAIRIRRPWDRWWAKGAIAGIVGGIPMGLYLMAVCAAIGLGWLFPPNAVATNWVTFRPAGGAFVPAAFITGTLEHGLMAALWGIGLAGVLGRFGRPLASSWSRAIGVGLIWGLLAFSTTGVVIGPGISPAIMWIPRGHSLIGHLLYGLTTALVLRAWLVRPRLRVTFMPEAAATRPERVRAGE